MTDDCQSAEASNTEGPFRTNVAMVIVDAAHHVLWAQRIDRDVWQFPQGGIQQGESPQQAMYRELQEEVGLAATDVTILGQVPQWLTYRFPPGHQSKYGKGLYVGQQQKWFLLQLRGESSCLDVSSGDSPEFRSWKWVSYWYPLHSVVDFKKEVYRKALTALAPLLAAREESGLGQDN